MATGRRYRRKEAASRSTTEHNQDGSQVPSLKPDRRTPPPVPVSMAARIQQLALPKPDRLGVADRRSVYWLDKLPPQRTGSTTKIELTPRWLDLCTSRRVSSQIPVFPAWTVSQRALRAVPSERLRNLGEPRSVATGWQRSRALPVPLSRGSQTAVASPRICQLARPKPRRDQEGSGQRPRPEPGSHVSRKANAHIELLATPKHDHPLFRGERSACWPVTRTARRFVAGSRLLELSVPKERKALFEGYDPYAVSRAARSASPSPRVQRLCLPLPRKCVSQ